MVRRSRGKARSRVKQSQKKKSDMVEKGRRSRGEETRSTLVHMRGVITVLYLMRRLDSLHSLEAK